MEATTGLMDDGGAAQAAPPVDPAAEAYRKAGMVNPTLVTEGGRSYYIAGPTGKGAGDTPADAANPFSRADTKAPTDAPAEPEVNPFSRDGAEAGPPGGVSATSAAVTGALSGLTFGALPDIAGLSAAGQQTPWARGPTVGKQVPGDPVVGGFNLAKEALFGQPADNSAMQRFQQAREAQKNFEGAAADQQPLAYYPAEVGAGLAIPVGGALKTGASYGMRVWEAIKTGAPLGAIGGFFGGDSDIKSRAEGAGVGTVLGAGLGAAIPTIAAAGKAGLTQVAHALHLDQIPDAFRAWRNPATLDDVAARHVGETALKARGGELRPGDESFADQHGMPVANVDRMGEEGRSLLRTQTNVSPTAQQDAQQYFKDNANSFAERTAKFVRSFGPLSAGGKAPMREELDNLARQQNRPAYTKAYTEGDKVVWSDKLEQLMGSDSLPKAVDGAMHEWRDWQAIDGFGSMNPRYVVKGGGLVTPTGGKMPVFPNIQMWDYTARMLDGWAGEASRKGNGPQALKFSELSRQVKAELDNIVPAYQAARAEAAKHFGASDAYEAGREFVSRTMDMSEAEQAHGDFKPAQKALFQDGFFGNLADKITQTGRRTQLIDTIERSPDAQARIKLAGGPEALGKFTTYMRIQHIAEMSAKALGNSTTFKQMVASGAVGLGAGIGEGLIQGDGVSATKVLSAAIGYGLHAGKQKINTQLANRITDMLLSNDPKVLQRAVDIARNNDAVKEGIRNVELLFERATGAAAGRAAGSMTGGGQ